MNGWSRWAAGCCLTATFLLSACDTGGGGGGSGGAGTFANPILNGGADPWAIRRDGYYYYTHTVGNAIQIWKSRSLTDMAAAETAVVWTPPADGPNAREIWAPELHWLDGKWYIYYAADDGDNANHRMFVLESASDDALGEYVDRGKIADPSDKWAIDGTVVRKPDGSLYFVWSGWEGDENVSQRLYIAPMSDPYTISGDRVEISRPELSWETIGEPTVNEGPEALLTDKQVHVVYSASGSWTDDYALGLLTADLDADLLDPASWRKQPEPVFSKTDRVFGPGHASFVKSPDGKEDWIVYHAAIASGAGWNRNVRAQPFRWNEDGSPDFGEPLAPGALLPVPSGEPKRLRLEAEDAKLEGMEATAHAEASGGKAAAGREDETGAAWEADVQAGGAYTLALRYRNEAIVPKELSLTVNGGTAIPFPLDAGLNGEWANAFATIELKAGRNELRLGGGDRQLTFDYIDVLRTDKQDEEENER